MKERKKKRKLNGTMEFFFEITQQTKQINKNPLCVLCSPNR